MQDINFDELDKAVNSILKNGDKKTDPDNSEADDKSETAVDEKIITQSKPVIVPQRHRGQFMDMVHPSSDMTSQNLKRDVTASSPIRRQLSAIKPLSPDVIKGLENNEEEPTDMPVVDRSDVNDHIEEDDLHPKSNLPSDAENRAAEIASAELLLSGDDDQFTDEIADNSNSEVADDIAENKDSIEGSIPDESSDTYSETPEATSWTGPEAEIKDYQESQSQSQSSPFVETADLEKRPLGAFSDNLDDNNQNNTSAELPVSTQEDDKVDSEEPVNLGGDELAIELNPEIVSVEADATSPDNGETSSNNGRTQFISRQYQVDDQEDESDDENAVFDTRQYHQPLEPPAKNKSHTFFYVILFILIIATGSAVGYLIWGLKLF
ncbi:hypothetical protein EOL73_01645 [Candidatus Saccharibacteria bacterium]|nr:hypothetical protein [Candidatus Saccharibacteria bacterium]NCU40440.1 hypothetical protein [Candidatus Saccharibacteria bacterium]